MTVNNQFVDVSLYLKPGLAALRSFSCAVRRVNKKFDNFQDIEYQLGKTVTYRLNSRFRAQNSLVVNFEGVQDRFESLTVDTPFSVPMSFTAQDLLFNVKDEFANGKTFMDKYGTMAIRELATNLEHFFLQCAEDGPYRWYGDGVTDITSYTQLAQAQADDHEYGHTTSTYDVYLPNRKVPTIVASGLNQFVLKRNEEISAQWMIGDCGDMTFMRTNLLPIHTSGTVGNSNQTLTLVSNVVSPDGQTSTLTFSGATANDANAIKKYDKMYFQRTTGLRYVTFIGHFPTDLTVQMKVLNDAAADNTGTVVVQVQPALISDPTSRNQSVNIAPVAGMTAKILPSHQCSLMTPPEAFLGALPKLYPERPFDSGSMTDEDTGASLRFSSGAVLGQNQRGSYFQCLAGRKLIPEYGFGLVFTLPST